MTDHVTMTLEEFETCAARWGATTALWPERERRLGDDLLTVSAEARAARDAFEAVDAALAAAPGDAAPLPEGLAARILADAATETAARANTAMRPAARPAAATSGGGLLGLLDRFLPVWRPAAACFASAAVGIWLGYVAPQNIAMAATAMASLDSDYAQTSDVAFLGDDYGYSDFGDFE